MTHLISIATLTILSGAATSDGVALDGHIPATLQMPDAWTAADISFQGSKDGATWRYIYKEEGTILTIPTAEYHRIVLPSSYLTDHKYLKVCSGTAALPVNQAADRVFYLEFWE